MNAHQGLAYDADPESDKPALLLIHGLLSSRLHWDPNKALKQSFRLIRVDLPAHGCSPPPQTPEAAHPAAIVQALNRLRADLGIASWHICGQSFGAGLSLRYALEFPESCIAHIFTNGNAALRRVWLPQDRAAHSKMLEKLKDGGRTAIRKLPYHPIHARRFPADIRDLLAREADKVDPAGYAMLQQEAVPRLSVHDRLASLMVPTLLVNGKRERRFQPVRDWLEQTHRNIQIVDLDGGHSVNVECPDAFNRVATAFLLEK
jgi:pimeloyl-ACP methyl ester carboxylesterase